MYIDVKYGKNEFIHISNVDTFKKDGDDLFIYTGIDMTHSVQHCFDLLDVTSILIVIDEENDEYDENERAKWGILA